MEIITINKYHKNLSQLKFLACFLRNAKEDTKYKFSRIKIENKIGRASNGSIAAKVSGIELPDGFYSIMKNTKTEMILQIETEENYFPVNDTFDFLFDHTNGYAEYHLQNNPHMLHADLLNYQLGSLQSSIVVKSQNLQWMEMDNDIDTIFFPDKVRHLIFDGTNVSVAVMVEDKAKLRLPLLIIK